MFIGHFGLSFAAKKAAPKVSLGTLFMATLFVDIIWPFLLVSDIEKVAIVPGYTKSNALQFLYFPYTHSLLTGIIWGVIVGFIYWFFKRDKRGALVVGLCVLSHWFFDLIVHTADLPLTPFNEYKVGFGLWNHVALSLTMETVIFLAGAYLYATFTKSKTPAGRWVLWAFVIFLLIFQFANTFGPPPSDSIMSLFVTLITLIAIIILIAYWVDKKRVVIDDKRRV